MEVNRVALWCMELPEMYIKSMKIEGSRVCPYKLPLSTSRSEMHFKMISA